MQRFKDHGVYEKVPVSEAWRVTGRPPIGTRWVDINKGCEVFLEYRSRLVAQEIKMDKREELFAATPPLEAKNLLFSMAVTKGLGLGKGWIKKLDFIDVKRAYFHALARRNVYAKFPKEDHQGGICGKLLKSMYGMRDAAQNWDQEFR